MNAISRNLWAPIAKPKRGGEWVIWTCVRSTRREAKLAYVEDIDPSAIKQHLKRIRFGRVDVVEQDKP